MVTRAPSMKQAAWHVVLLQTLPAEQAVPRDTVDQPVSFVAGSHF